MTEEVTVTTDGRDIDAVVESLRAAGLTVAAVHREIGVVSGTVGAADRAALAAVPGVIGVEADRGITLPPPDSDVQ